MKINKLKINAFGNLKNKEIELSNGINIIHGENESGKSTLLKFIVGMFYGISKNKRGKEFSDYDRYMPWNAEEFSGKMEYSLDNDKSFEIFRDFNKKNTKIYNSNGEDISKEFNIDKTNGNEFFIEQTNIDENTFLSSLVSMQQEVVLNTNDQNVLIQKISNFANSGDDNISYKKAVEKLNKKQIEEIGTTRTTGRPINIIKDEKYKLQDELGELEEFKDKKYFLEEEKNNIENEIKNNEIKLNYLKEIKKIIDEEKIEKEKNKLNEKIKNENEEKINELNLEKNKLINKINLEQNSKNNLDNNKNNLEEKNKKLNYKNIIFIILELIMIFILIINNLIIKNNIINYFCIGLIPTIIIFYLILKNNEKKSKNKTNNNLNENNKKIINNKINNFENNNSENNLDNNENYFEEKINILNSQIELLEKNNEDKKIEINKNNEKINFEFNIKKENIINNYKNKINNIEELNYYLNNEKINFILDEYLEKINKNKLKLHTLELDKQNIIPKLEKMANIEEKLEELNEQENEILKNNDAIELTKEILEIAYKKMKENITPEFTKKLSENIEKISNEKYKKIKINDEEGIIVEKENGEYIEASKLSIGTIDQLYLSLRFAIINEISKENMPIILDESFAYCDTNRLKNILLYLNNEFKENQIIIFTCTNREKEALNELNINFKNIEL